MDACLGGRTPNTLNLTRKIRSEWGGCIVAISCDPFFNDDLKRNGATCACGKTDLPEIIDVVLADPANV